MDIRIGFNVVFKPVEKCFGYAERHGLNHLEIDLIREHSYVETFTDKRIRNLRRLSAKYGVSLSLHTPYSINPADAIPMLRDANVRYLLQCVRVAHKLGATHVTTHIGHCNGLPVWTWMRRLALARLVGNFSGILKVCAKLKVRLAVENVNPMPGNSEFFYLGDNVRDLRFLFKKLPSPWFNLCLDIGHANTNEGVLPYIRAFGKKIINVHFHDNRGKSDDHIEIGRGTVPWKRVVRELKRIKFYGPFISENFNLKPHQAKKLFLSYF